MKFGRYKLVMDANTTDTHINQGGHLNYTISTRKDNSVGFKAIPELTFSYDKLDFSVH